MGFIRSGIASMGALALVAATAAAADPVRPSDSVVSAPKAAAATAPAIQRQGATLEDANQAGPAKLIIIFIILLGGGFAISQMISESP